MDRTLRARALFVVVLTMALSTPVVAAQDIPQPTLPPDGELARVVDVVDGDTIRVERSEGSVERVRYIGIDTPEIGRDGEPDEPWAREATNMNDALVGDEVVLLERDVSETDQYDRLLRYVWVEYPTGWRMVNGELAEKGLADVRAYEPDTKHHQWLSQLRDEARADGRGMYGDEASDEGNLLDQIVEFFLGS